MIFAHRSVSTSWPSQSEAWSSGPVALEQLNHEHRKFIITLEMSLDICTRCAGSGFQWEILWSIWQKNKVHQTTLANSFGFPSWLEISPLPHPQLQLLSLDPRVQSTSYVLAFEKWAIIDNHVPAEEMKRDFAGTQLPGLKVSGFAHGHFHCKKTPHTANHLRSI